MAALTGIAVIVVAAASSVGAFASYDLARFHQPLPLIQCLLGFSELTLLFFVLFSPFLIRRSLHSLLFINFTFYSSLSDFSLCSPFDPKHLAALPCFFLLFSFFPLFPVVNFSLFFLLSRLTFLLILIKASSLLSSRFYFFVFFSHLFSLFLSNHLFQI